jgi:hypothetical protein
MKEHDLFGAPPPVRKPFRRKVTNPHPMMLKVPRAARVVAQAIENIGHAATEAEMVRECQRMRDAGIHDYDLGSTSNLRNRIQRNWAGSKIYQETWGPKGYAAIFIRVPGSPVRWCLVPGFKANLQVTDGGEDDRC